MSEIKKKVLFVAGLGLAVILFLIITGKPERELKDERSIHAAVDTVESNTHEVTDESTSQTIIVEVKGEVNKPGVYEISSDSRVNDMIEKAGGFTDDAAVEEINLAQKAHDEMSILVRKEDEASLPAENAFGSNQEGVVRVNEATQEELETLNGIGAAKAQAILQYREENGMFQQPEDLLNVSGIGEKTLENFIDQIQIP